MNFLNDENNQRLAAYLREKRIEQNLNFDDISSKIGIPIQHLKRIEEGDFEEYDAFYLKMYLKKYASSLSLDIDELYQRFYGEEVKQPEVEANVKKQVKSKQNYQKRNSRNNLNIGKIIGLVCAVVIIVLGIFIGVDMVRGWVDSNNNAVDSGPQVTNPDAPNITDDQDEEEEDGQEEEEQLPEVNVEPITTINKLSHEGNVQTFAIATEAEEIEITLNFAGTSWVGTSAGETITFESGTSMTQAGVTFHADNSENIIVNEDGTLSFNFGNIQVLEMTVNGKPLEIATAGLSQQWIVLNLTMEME